MQNLPPLFDIYSREYPQIFVVACGLSVLGLAMFAKGLFRSNVKLVLSGIGVVWAVQLFGFLIGR
ncbi:MAG: hypothetical protein QGG36_15470 [Pirellulaceae bacterium]|jgi:hypothetical protein|nr:hypothetical protein [Pirellulaceae bacterium]MDP7017204.1 hypothetical protein [Pirellulaceae bacterium]